MIFFTLFLFTGSNPNQDCPCLDIEFDKFSHSVTFDMEKFDEYCRRNSQDGYTQDSYVEVNINLLKFLSISFIVLWLRYFSVNENLFHCNKDGALPQYALDFCVVIQSHTFDCNFFKLLFVFSIKYKHLGHLGLCPVQ